MCIIMNIMGLDIQRLGHDSFKIEDEDKIIYIDPYQIEAGEKADYIFVTHDHFDHCSTNDIRKIVKMETIIIASKNCEGMLSKFRGTMKDVVFMGQNESKDIRGLKVETLPAYNINKFMGPNQPFHPKSYGGLSFIIMMGKLRVLHAGDTDSTPELRSLKNIDIAMLPVSGKYVMTSDEAANLALSMRPKVAIPMHYGNIVGSDSDAVRFKSIVEQEGVKAQIL